MKILLIDPPYDRLIGFRSEWFPVGISYIGSYLHANGNEVSIYNAEHSNDTSYKSVVKYSEDFNKYKVAIANSSNSAWEEIKERISLFKPEVVGVSVNTPKVPSALKIAEICKTINSDITVVFGGHHSTIKPDEMLLSQNVDFVVRGEGEETFCELVNHLQNCILDYRTIAGLSFRDNGQVIHNVDRKLICSLDSLPLPARDKLVDLDSYTPVQLSMVMTSRGCPYKCGFCSSQNMWGRKVRFRSVDNVLNELNELKQRFAVKNITFLDDSFTANRDRIKDLCSTLIEKKMDITWSCLTRVGIISDDLIILMKKAGCTKLDIGIESGNQRVLDLIDKGITLKQVKEAVDILKHNKMYWSGFFMFGFPTETEEEVLDTLNFLHELKPNWANISIFTPYPGTKLYDLAKVKGMISEPVDYTLYSHQNPYDRFTDTMSQEKFSALGKHMLNEVHRYNSSYKSLMKRALTRQYHKNPKLFLQDIKKVAMWLRK